MTRVLRGFKAESGKSRFLRPSHWLGGRNNKRSQDGPGPGVNQITPRMRCHHSNCKPFETGEGGENDHLLPPSQLWPHWVSLLWCQHTPRITRQITGPTSSRTSPVAARGHDPGGRNLPPVKGSSRVRVAGIWRGQSPSTLN